MARHDAELIHYAANLAECPPDDLPEFALSGRSNVGKSSLINYLMQRKRLAYTSGQPGKTQCLIYFRIDARWNLVDMPGYGFAKVSPQMRQRWRKSLEEYFLGRDQLAGILQLIDLGVGPTKDDVERAAFLSDLGRPICLVFTKSDKVAKTKREEHLRRALGKLDVPETTGVVLTSATEKFGAKELWAWIGDHLRVR